MVSAPDRSATLCQSVEPTPPLRVCLVTCFPPSRGDLNEYGYHLASALRDNPHVELLVLADETADDCELKEFQVQRCWRFDSLLTPARLLRAIRKADPDVVWFNMGFSTFARQPLPAFLSITGPALARLSGFYTHITLHTLFERINLTDAGVRMPRLYRTAGRIATKVLLGADDLSVLLPSFRSELLKNYKADTDRIHFRPHGTFSRPSLPTPASDSKTEQIVLAFGYWGTYKRLELILECWAEINRQIPKAKFMIAGMDHPSTPGYLGSLKSRYAESSNIQFLGYVPESELPDMFRTASLLVLPYSSAAGTSGVVHQACEYGLPMVAAGIPEIEELAREYGVAAEFYPPGDGSTLQTHILRILKSDELRDTMAQRNFDVGRNMQISQVVGGYLDLFKSRTRKPGRPQHARTRHSAPVADRLTQTVGNWLLHSGIEESSGGVARYHLAQEQRNKPVSTEITGYCASGLVVLYQRTGDERYLDAALRQARFLAKAWDESCSAMPFECEGVPRYSYFFDVGIIVRGLLAVWRRRPESSILTTAIRCGESMHRDFFDGKDFHPIITLPDKKPLEHEKARWSRSPGCYQLKAALAWQELWQATGDERYRAMYREMLQAGLESHISFLPGSEKIDWVMDRLHAYSYFLEGLLPAIAEPSCQEAMRAGIKQLKKYAETIAPQFLRSDVLAQLLRVRIFADRAGVVPMDRQVAASEAALIREFQSSDPDVRLNGGFWFGRKERKIQPYMNPVSTVFCYQALEMWDRLQRGATEFHWQELI